MIGISYRIIPENANGIRIPRLRIPVCSSWFYLPKRNSRDTAAAVSLRFLEIFLCFLRDRITTGYVFRVFLRF